MHDRRKYYLYFLLGESVKADSLAASTSPPPCWRFGAWLLALFVFMIMCFTFCFALRVLFCLFFLVCSPVVGGTCANARKARASAGLTTPPAGDRVFLARGLYTSTARCVYVCVCVCTCGAFDGYYILVARVYRLCVFCFQGVRFFFSVLVHASLALLLARRVYSPPAHRREETLDTVLDVRLIQYGGVDCWHGLELQGIDLVSLVIILRSILSYS